VPPPADEIGEQLAGWGVVARVATRGRASGREVAVAVGFVEEPDGSLLVAAGDPDADWARNLEADPRCDVRTGDRTFAAVAEALDPAEAGRAVRELILRYGTPAERLGRGPAFRLRPLEPRARGGRDDA
jgi:deazaflavin-dependent oxidoreductase (nitroreductase family)